MSIPAAVFSKFYGKCRCHILVTFPCQLKFFCSKLRFWHYNLHCGFFVWFNKTYTKNAIFSSFYLGITKGKRRPVQTIQDAPRIPGDGEHKCNLCYVEGDKKGAFHEKKELLKHQRKYHPEHFPKSEYRFTCDLCFVEGGKKGIFYGKNNFLKHQSKNHPELFT